MKVKRYFATDMRKALAQVRDEQGPDAVIISNKKVPGGVELVAAIDYDPSLFSRPETAARSDATAALPEDRDDDAVHVSLSGSRNDTLVETRFNAATESGPAAVSAADALPPRQAAPDPAWQPRSPEVEWSEDPSLANMRDEINGLRDLLEHQLSGFAWGDMGRRQPVHAGLLRKLANLDIDPALARELVQKIPADEQMKKAWRQVLALLAHRIRVTDDDILEDGGVIALVGSTGVGKTTTAAKLASRFCLRHGADSVALITTDNFRIGAHEQLRTYARILGVPIHVERDAAGLESALNALYDRRLVIVDTAGMSQRDSRLHDYLSLLANRQRPVQPYLVMSTTSQRTGMHEVVTRFGQLPLAGCVLTKLDETASLGAALSVVVKHDLPVAYVSDGQRVPEDIAPARAHSLVSQAVQISHDSGVNCSTEELEQAYGREAIHAH